MLIMLSVLLPGSDSGSLKFLTWGEKCSPGENLKPYEECDLSKGLLCQLYTQGTYCGCKIGSSLTWDKESGECRRRLANECFYDEITTEDWKELPFNHKCHERAECVNVNWTAITGRKNNDDKHVCQCQDGYVGSKDFSECVNINRTPSLASQMDLGFLICGVSVVLWRNRI